MISFILSLKCYYTLMAYKRVVQSFWLFVFISKIISISPHLSRHSFVFSLKYIFDGDPHIWRFCVFHIVSVTLAIQYCQKSCICIIIFLWCYFSGDRLHDVDVLLSNNADVNNIRQDSFQRCYYRQGVASLVETWLCKAHYARYVMITISNTSYIPLTLCEVQVFGSEIKTTGKLFP